MANIITVANVQGYLDAQNVAWLSAEDVARGFGFTQDKNGVTYVRWETINNYLSGFGFSQRVGKGDYLPENMVYRLGFKANNEAAVRFQSILADDVLPSIRKTGSYTMSTPKTYSEALRQLADEVEAKEKAQLLLAEKSEQLDESKEWYSIKRWAKLHRRNWRSYSWRKLKAVSHELGYEVKKIFDGNYDEVNIYYKVVFEAVYGK